jgi:hypothetical protein
MRRLRKSSRCRSMKITSSSTSAPVPSGPSNGAIIDWIKSMGLSWEVSTT